MTSDFDEDTLAELYETALKLEKSGDFEGAAKFYHQALQMDPDDHVGASVRLASMGQAPSPTRAPMAYVTTLFDQHADMFDKILVTDLGYDVPNLSRKILEKNDRKYFKSMLDIGCGTGLTGEALKDMTDQRTGFDLSENMVEIAYDKGDYDTLYVADAIDYLKDNDDGPWNLICATDVLPYMGDISEFIRLISDNMVRNACLVLSTETLSEEEFSNNDYKVGSHQRFAHRIEYIHSLCAQNGLAMIDHELIIIRHEEGKPIYGHLILAEKS